MEAYSLYQLNEYIRRVIALNFREPLWIEAEISQCKDSRGNFYLELIQKEEDGDDIIAQVSAAIWYRNYKFIAKKHGDLVEDLLVAGTQVRLKCTVDFHERYGLKLLVQDVDPNFTFGKLELKRQEIINQLESEGLMELNKSVLIPPVIQRVAVISSSGAAGYQDFIEQLTDNGYGYTFKIDLYDSAVQGQNVGTDTTAAIREIVAKSHQYDIVTIIRGGGSKLDLSGYDNFEIAQEIALSEMPFVIGIGHDIDTTVTDMVACLSLKTPTAVADYIIDRNMTYEARIEQLIAQMIRRSEQLMRHQDLQLTHLSERLSMGIAYVQGEATGQIMLLSDALESAIGQTFTEQHHTLERLGLILDARDPARILSQGYAYVSKADQHIDSIESLHKDDQIEIHLADGQLSAKVI